MTITANPLHRGPLRRLARTMLEKEQERSNVMNLKHFSVSETSVILGVDPKTVRLWLAEGKLRGWKVYDRGNWRINQSEIEKLISSFATTYHHDQAAV